MHFPRLYDSVTWQSRFKFPQPAVLPSTIYSMMPKEKYSVLVVDDCEDDRLFLRRAIQSCPKLYIVGELGDGEAAIAYLEGLKSFGNREKNPFPDAMLLDLKMPRKTGHEVLEWLRAQPFKDLFVAVISGSFLPEDIERSKALGANAYYKKNALKVEQEAMIREIAEMLDNPK
jgi:CheY-like chemotaxis protein